MKYQIQNLRSTQAVCGMLQARILVLCCLIFGYSGYCLLPVLKGDETATGMSPVADRKPLTAIFLCKARSRAETELVFPEFTVEEIDRSRFWIACLEKEEWVFPVVCVEGAFTQLNGPLSDIESPRLARDVRTNAGHVGREAVFFDGSQKQVNRVVDFAIAYHGLLLNGLSNAEQDLDPIEPESLPNLERAAEIERKRHVSSSFAAQSDDRTRDYASLSGVETRFDRPCLILASEKIVAG